MIMFATYQKHLYLLSKTIVLFENSKNTLYPNRENILQGGREDTTQQKKIFL
jgi:hypothetical protein